jgi:hypothetical protein
MMKKIETWRRRSRDPKNGLTRRAGEPMTEPEASGKFLGAARMEGRALREEHDDFADTMPRVFRPEQPD